MFPFGGGPSNLRVGRTRARMDQMDCADIMLKAVERKRSRSIARRESFSGTDDDLKKFREAVESNEKDSSLQQELEEYAVKVREIRGTKEITEKTDETTRNGKDCEFKRTETSQTIKCNEKLQSNAAEVDTSLARKESKDSTDDHITDRKTITKDSTEIVSRDSEICEKNANDPEITKTLFKDDKKKVSEILKESFSTFEDICFLDEEVNEIGSNDIVTEQETALNKTEDNMDGPANFDDEYEISEAMIETIENEKEEQTIVNEKDKKPIDTEKEEPATEIEKEEPTIENEKEEQAIENEKEEKSIESKKEELTTENEKEEQTIENETEEQTVEKEKEEQTIENETEEQTVENEKENIVIEKKDQTIENETEENTLENEKEKENIDEKEKQNIENMKKDPSEEEDDDNSFLSIVDRIKNDITTLKTLSKNNNQTSSKICDIKSETEDSRGENEKWLDSPIDCDDKDEIKKRSNLEILDQQRTTDHKQTGIKVALDRVYREKSVGGDIQVPKELSSHLMSLSSANISEELKKSCSNIVARSVDMDMSKEYLLKRLEKLLSQEKKQLTDDLSRRKEQLRDTRNIQANEIGSLNKRHKEELRQFRNSRAQNFAELECDYLDQAENLKKEIELLENEKENMTAPTDLISNYLHTGPVKKAQLTELEAELECCSCGHICKPPCKIYQCPEGDLLCQSCWERTDSLTICPRCQSGLVGQVSRNKGLEKIAARYYQ